MIDTAQDASNDTIGSEGIFLRTADRRRFDYVMNAVPGMNTIIKPVEYAHRPRHTDPPGPAQPGPRVRAAKTARWRATAWHCESTMDTDTRMRTCL